VIFQENAGQRGDGPQLPTATEPGDPQAAEDLLPLVYQELRRLAAYKMAHEPPGQTLQPTALVHEVWIRLAAQRNQTYANRTHFFAVAAEAMRRILIDRARRRQAVRRGGQAQRVNTDALEIAAPAPDDELLALDEALGRLAERDPQKAELVKLRYYVGLTLAEAAEVLGVSEPTVKRHWAYARAWLFRDLEASA
jgi:RNA polymerase sigma factor (TIGR02999 family)